MTPDMSSMDWQGRIATLEREIERLRAVLEQISGSGTVDGADARAALRFVAALRDTAPAEEGWGYDTETGEEGEP